VANVMNDRLLHFTIPQLAVILLQTMA